MSLPRAGLIGVLPVLSGAVALALGNVTDGNDWADTTLTSKIDGGRGG